MLDAGLMVFPGVVMTKSEAIGAIRSAPPWSRYELRDVRVAQDGDVATVTYEAVAWRGDDAPYRAVMSSTYLWREARWRLFLHPQSPIAAAG